MVSTMYSKAEVLLYRCCASFLQPLRPLRLNYPRVYLDALTFCAGDVACQPGPVAIVTEVYGRLDEVILKFAVEQHRVCLFVPTKDVYDTYRGCHDKRRCTKLQAPSHPAILLLLPTLRCLLAGRIATLHASFGCPYSPSCREG
jgi:hypothetical protein